MGECDEKHVQNVKQYVSTEIEQYLINRCNYLASKTVSKENENNAMVSSKNKQKFFFLCL